MVGTTRRRASIATAIAASAALLLAACGSSGSGSDSSDDSTPKKPDAADSASTAAPVGKKATSKPVPSKGCGTSKVRQVTTEEHTLLGDRNYLLTTPEEHDGKTPLPLVVDIHGLLEGSTVHTKMTAMPEFAQEHGFVVVDPNGTGNPVHWEVDVDPDKNKDLAYYTAMLDELEQDLCLDTSRVYATGLSNGAFMSSTLACVMADRFAAIAPVAGLTREKGCKPSRKVPVLAFHGTADPILLFNGGVGDLTGLLDGKKAGDADIPEADLNGEGYPATAQIWAEANGCKAKATDDDRTDTVIERTWSCPADSPVVFEIIEGGGHSWPGSEFSKAVENVVGKTDTSIVANDLIWAFFQRFALPTS